MDGQSLQGREHGSRLPVTRAGMGHTRSAGWQGSKLDGSRCDTQQSVREVDRPPEGVISSGNGVEGAIDGGMRRVLRARPSYQ